jgi:hypothetical protein
MKNLTSKELSEIKSTFSNLKQILEGEYDLFPEYKIITISVFDHFLNEDELDEIYINDLNEINRRRNLIINSIQNIFSNTVTYLSRYKRHNRFFIHKTKSLRHLLLHCDIQNQNWDTGQRYDIILPEFSAIYSEDFDWSNVIFYKDLERVKPLMGIIEKSGLHILYWGEMEINKVQKNEK